MKNTCFVFAAYAAWIFCFGHAEAVEPPPVITIAEARAKMGRGDNSVVRVRGQLTFSSQKLGVAFVQDVTGGIGYDPRLRMKRLPNPGEWVEVTGVLARRQGMVMILRHASQFGAPKVATIPAETPRVTPFPFDLEDAAEMRIDGRFTRVMGVIRRVVAGTESDAPTMVEVSSPTGHAIARLPWQVPQAEMDRWVNAAVTMNAVLVCQASPPMLPNDAEAVLFVPGKSAWTVQGSAMDEIFARSPVSLSHEIPVTPRTSVSNRLHVTGVVTAARPRSWVSLRTSAGSVQVMTRQTDVFSPGERLSVACWPQNHEGRVVLLDGVCRSLGKGPPPEPDLVGLDLMTGMPGPMELVQVTGELRNLSISGGLPRLALELDSGQTCLVQWRTFLTTEQVSGLADGSRMHVVGILNPMREGALDEIGISYAVQPRTLADMQVIHGPSWWTPERLHLAVWSLLGIVGVALPTALFSRWEVRRQQQQIRHIEARSIAEEERRRISREFHDSLQQQLAGAALHLETLKGAVQAAPEMMPRLIEDTTAMIRHCQIEARHCIWDLRTDAPARESLAEALAEWLHMRGSQVTATALHFEMRGDVPPLGEDVPFQILRIVQEAVNNALAHAEARHVSVRLLGKAEELLIEVEDDGRGFDPLVIRQGRFGLSGQRERAQKIGARLQFLSPPDNGTRVILCVPTQQPKHASICTT